MGTRPFDAGLIVDGHDALLVDSLLDLPLTQAMLDGFAAAMGINRLDPTTTFTGKSFRLVGDTERIVTIIDTCYREFRGNGPTVGSEPISVI